MLDINWNGMFSAFVGRSKSSEIRRLLSKSSGDPNIISFGGGFPGKISVVEIKEEIDRILSSASSERARRALQYGPTEGDKELRDAIVGWLKWREDIEMQISSILPTTGAQQALFLAGMLFINPGDFVVCGAPSYLAAIQVFKIFGARFVTIPVDEDGMRVDLLSEELGRRRQGSEKQPKFIYTVPDYQNPSGVTLSLERRQALVDIAREFSIPVLEDTPYRELVFTGSKLPTVFSLDENRLVLLINSFSKLLSGGLRLGYIIGAKEVIDKLIILKQGADLCTSPLIQLAAAGLLRNREFIEEHLGEMRRLYKSKRDLMLSLLEKHMPAGVKWNKPNGGLFIWLQLPESIKAAELLRVSEEQKVVFAIGRAFYAEDNIKADHTLRMNFSFESMERIKIGVERLAKAVKQCMS